MSVLNPSEGEKRTADSGTTEAKQPGAASMQSGQTFQVREGDRIVIDKRKFRPTFTTYRNRTIITINEK